MEHLDLEFIVNRQKIDISNPLVNGVNYSFDVVVNAIEKKVYQNTNLIGEVSVCDLKIPLAYKRAMASVRLFVNLIDFTLEENDEIFFKIADDNTLRQIPTDEIVGEIINVEVDLHGESDEDEDEFGELEPLEENYSERVKNLLYSRWWTRH